MKPCQGQMVAHAQHAFPALRCLLRASRALHPREGASPTVDLRDPSFRKLRKFSDFQDLATQYFAATELLSCAWHRIRSSREVLQTGFMLASYGLPKRRGLYVLHHKNSRGLQRQLHLQPDRTEGLHFICASGWLFWLAGE